MVNFKEVSYYNHIIRKKVITTHGISIAHAKDNIVLLYDTYGPKNYFYGNVT